jgi:hypothetical protein
MTAHMSCSPQHQSTSAKSTYVNSSWTLQVGSRCSTVTACIWAEMLLERRLWLHTAVTVTHLLPEWQVVYTWFEQVVVVPIVP